MRLKVSQAMEVRLGRQRAPQFEEGDHLVPYLRSANIENGRLSLGDVKEMNFTPAEQEIFSLHPGDVLVTEGSGSADAVGTSAVWSGELSGPVCFQNTLLRLRPRPGVTDGRYLAWWARHAHGTRQFSTVATGANIQHLGSEGLKHLELGVPSLDEQRRIADFLDGQVARIDAVIRTREQQRVALPELFLARAGDLLPPSSSGPALGSAANVVDTEHKTAPTVPDGGYWIAGTSALKRGVLDVPSLRETDVASFREWTSRAVPRPGDVLLSREAPVGEVALLADSDPQVAIGQRVVLIRPRTTALHSGFLRLVLMSPLLRRAISDASVGSLHPHLNISEITRLRLPALAMVDQRRMAMRHSELLCEESHADSMISTQIRSLADYKKSLISAAVSGEFDVTTASGRALPTV